MHVKCSVWLFSAMVFLTACGEPAVEETELSSASSSVYSWPAYSMVPILFVPTDWSVSSAEVQAEAAAIRSAMAEIQQFYATNHGGRTFVLNDLQVVQANGAKEAYGITWGPGNPWDDGVVSVGGSFEAAVVQELHTRGYPTPPGQNEDGYTVLVFAKGAGGWAGGRELTGANGGWAIVGDWCIDSIQGSVAEGAYWWSGRRKQTGAAAHELGHAFGLPHPDSVGGSNTTSVMGNSWDYPTIGLNDYDRSSLATNKSAFFTVPAPPAGQNAVAINGTQIQVSWTDRSPNETGFRISNGVTTATVGANATSYVWSGLSPGTYMCFAIQSYSATGASPWTPWACTTTPSVPAMPTGQLATVLSGTQIRVSWNDTSGNESGFRIHNGVTSVTVGANVTSYTWGGLSPGTYMCFAVQSFNVSGASAYTPWACTTIPALPATPAGQLATAISGVADPGELERHLRERERVPDQQRRHHRHRRRQCQYVHLERAQPRDVHVLRDPVLQRVRVVGVDAVGLHHHAHHPGRAGGADRHHHQQLADPGELARHLRQRDRVPDHQRRRHRRPARQHHPAHLGRARLGDVHVLRDPVHQHGRRVGMDAVGVYDDLVSPAR